MISVFVDWEKWALKYYKVRYGLGIITVYRIGPVRVIINDETPTAY